ncbi:hypothetical protein DASC09_041420 [Saccharomycopsis crataegensis]|uniref:Transmembrane protein n=1 Tax=Saccharomycopsis crataegensis TaxID=43959 RepID=A0AAV5QQR5_9ASCO|nr:hypothetical protein DASC09_041420 [Saccharomycopsis crataegensis]
MSNASEKFDLESQQRQRQHRHYHMIRENILLVTIISSILFIGTILFDPYCVLPKRRSIVTSFTTNADPLSIVSTSAINNNYIDDDEFAAIVIEIIKIGNIKSTRDGVAPEEEKEKEEETAAAAAIALSSSTGGATTTGRINDVYNDFLDY